MHNYLHQTSTTLYVWTHKDKMPEYNSRMHPAEYQIDLEDWKQECTKTPVAESEQEKFIDSCILKWVGLDDCYLGEDVIEVRVDETTFGSKTNNRYFAYLKPVPEATTNKYRLGKKQNRAILEVATGSEYLVFPQGKTEHVKEYMDWLNNKSKPTPDNTELWREVDHIIYKESWVDALKELKTKFKIERI